MNDITSQISMRDNRGVSHNQPKSIRKLQESNIFQSQQASSQHFSQVQPDRIDRNVLDAPLSQLHNLDLSSNSSMDINLNKSFEIYSSPFEQYQQAQQQQQLIPGREPIKPQQSIPKLRNMKSRLDMLDNSQLTSFPLAPPRVCSEKVTESLKSPEINAQDFTQSRPNSQLFDVDPIVLVEDYIKNRQLNRKKLSVHDLKTSVKTFSSVDQNDIPQGPNYLTRAKSILSETFPSSLHSQSQQSHSSSSQPSTLLLTRNSIDEEESISSSTDFFSAKTSQSISLSSAGSIHTNVSNAPTLKLTDSHDNTFGEFSVPSTPNFASFSTSSSLRYCVICDTPLYEISSLLTQDNKFTEFVCSNCTERYEQLSKLIESFDQSVSEMRTIPEDASTDDIEELLNQPANKKSRTDSPYKGFSSHLVNKLHTQLESSATSASRSPQRLNRQQHHMHHHHSHHSHQQNLDTRQSQWLNEARRKLRWRWRLSGLLPQFLEKK